MAPKTSIHVIVHVLDKTVQVSCGVGSQRIRWLGNVAITRWDEENSEGWRTLGVPEKVLDSEGNEMDMGGTIHDLLEDQSEVTVVPSLKPNNNTSSGS